MKRAKPPLAIIDIGSNSARVVVYDREPSGHLRIVASARSSLRLVEGVVENHEIGAEAIERAREALVDFRAIAVGAGARAIRVYGTAAVREAADEKRFARMVERAVRAPLQLLDGDREALYGFHGALRGLESQSGLLFDLGGGSLQLTEFRKRKRLRSWSVPLGALRLSRRFIERDPPTEKEIKALRQHVDGFLEELPLHSIGKDGRLVGTGGTVRNLAKIDRFRAGTPVSRLHGHDLSRDAIKDIEQDLRSRPRRKRTDILGLSRDRSDSIVAGVVVISRVLARVDAGSVLVSGQGLREGLAYAALGEMDAEPGDVRDTSIAAMLSRFTGVDPAYGGRRATLATELFARLTRGSGRRSEVFASALEYAARVLDMGRAVDFFDRHEHAARIVLASELDGFSQVEVARIAAILHAADEEGIDLEDFDPLVTKADYATIERAAVVLLLADDLLERAPKGTMPRLKIAIRGDRVTIQPTRLTSWRPRGLGERFDRAFRRELIVKV